MDFQGMFEIWLLVHKVVQGNHMIVILFVSCNRRER